MVLGVLNINSPGLLPPPISCCLYGCWWRWCPTIPSEHLLLGSVGSYFWHSGTGVGGWAQLPLQCRRNCSKLYAAQGMRRCATDMTYGSCQSASLGCPSRLKSVNMSFRDTGPTTALRQNPVASQSCLKAFYQNPEPGTLASFLRMASLFQSKEF